MSCTGNGKTSFIAVNHHKLILNFLLLSCLRYLYSQLHELAHGSPSIRNIFLRPPIGKLHLRNSVSIHLVLSNAPSGDAREYLPPDSNNYLGAYDSVRICLFIIFCLHVYHLQAQLKVTAHAPIYESREQGYLRYKYVEGIETMIATHRQRFGLMSCSDKILKWNVLGIQGSLLSTLIEPIKISSITHRIFPLFCVKRSLTI